MLVRFGFFTRPSTIVPLLHRRIACIFKLFTPLASFSYATWSSATFLASCSEPWTSGNFNTLIVAITLQAVGLGLFTAPSTIVPSLHRLKPSIFKIFKPLASFSYGIWSSATFLASCSDPWTCGNFNTLIVSIPLRPVGLGLLEKRRWRHVTFYSAWTKHRDGANLILKRCSGSTAWNWKRKGLWCKKGLGNNEINNTWCNFLSSKETYNRWRSGVYQTQT